MKLLQTFRQHVFLKHSRVYTYKPTNVKLAGRLQERAGGLVNHA